MPERILFILNSSAGIKTGVAAEMRRTLSGCSEQIEIVETRERGDGTRLAREAREFDIRRIVAVGGDGTVNEVLNGIVGTDVELGIIPIGTGNDIARSLGLPLNNIEAALERALHGEKRTVDCVTVGNRLFLSMLGLGFPVEVTKAAEKVRYLRGSAAFAIGVYRALARLRLIDVKLILDDEKFDMRCICVMVQNTPFIGGGLPMVPSAKIDDGFLDVVTIGPMSKLAIMLHFPRVFLRKHLTHPLFAVRRSKKVRIESAGIMRRLLDGDIIETDATDAIEMEVKPGALKVIT